jgi:hypothetical protein
MTTLLKGFTVLVAAAGVAAAAQATTYEVAEVTGGGTISGKVLLGNAKVETQTLTITKDTHVCGTGTREVQWVRANGDALLDAVVYVENVEAGKPFPEGARNLVLDQKECRFQPYLQVMANGGKITPLNSDNVIHSTHAFELMQIADNKIARRTLFNMSQIPSDPGLFPRTVRLRRGKSVKIECDGHDFMHAWIFVARNPYYAVVDENGEFTITGVPPGTYVVRSWHGRLNEREATVEVTAGGTTDVTFSY